LAGGTYTTRVRRYKPRSCRGKYFKTIGPNGPIIDGTTDVQDSSEKTTGTQRTVSKGNPWPPRKSGFTGDLGGNFETTASYVEGNIPYRKLLGTTRFGQTNNWHGRVCTSPLGPSGQTEWPPNIRSSDDDLDEAGATAIARCKPTNSIANVSVFLGELMSEGIPRVLLSRDWQKSASAARAAGDDYLNAAFGWRPLVNDLTQIAHAVNHTDDAIKQLQRDSGRLVRRSYRFPTEYTSSTESLSYGSGYIPGFGQISQFLEQQGVRERKVETSRSQWFSGAFTYYIPEDLKGSSEISELRAKAELVFGLSLTPETVWNLTPWSWAVDWFSNTGDVISNISDHNRYGLILPYGYMMEHSISKYTYSLKGSKFWNSSEGCPNLTLVTESKVRRKANPFGFGVNWDGLDPFQVSILAALGLSRSG